MNSSKEHQQTTYAKRDNQEARNNSPLRSKSAQIFDFPDGHIPNELLPEDASSFTGGIFVEAPRPPYQQINAVLDRIRRSTDTQKLRGQKIRKPAAAIQRDWESSLLSLVTQVTRDGHLWSDVYSPRTTLFLDAVGQRFEFLGGQGVATKSGRSMTEGIEDLLGYLGD